MKKWLTPILAVTLTGAALTSCQKDENKATITPSNGVTLSSSASSVVLLQPNASQNALTYTWTPISSFAFSNSEVTAAPAVNYQLQLSKTADGFGYPGATIDAGNGRTKSVTVRDLNIALLGLGLVPGVATPVYVRLAAVVGSDTHSFVSNVMTLTATAYKECLPPNADTWGLVGPAGDGWPGSTPTDRMLTWDCDANAYVLRTALNAGEFKFRQNQDWAVNLGGAAGNLAQGVPLTTNGPNLSIATAGTYTVKLTVAGSGATVTGGTVTVVP